MIMDLIISMDFENADSTISMTFFSQLTYYPLYEEVCLVPSSLFHRLKTEFLVRSTSV